MRTILLSLIAACLVTASPAAFAIDLPRACFLGFSAVKEKRNADALPHLDLCLEENLPSEHKAFGLQLRASALAELKRWREAARDQQRSISLAKPTDVSAHVMLGAYLREDGRFTEALAALEAAKSFDEDGPGTGPGMAVYYHTGQTLQRAGRHREAIEAFTLGIPKQPDYGYAHFYRALSYEALGDKVQAKRDLFRVWQLSPKDGHERNVADKLMEYGFEVKVRE